MLVTQGALGEQDLEKKFNSIQAQLKRALEEKKILLERIDTLETAHGIQLKGYQDGEQKQAAVMQALHSKILEYKGNCHELESQLSVQRATFEHNQEQVRNQSDFIIFELNSCTSQRAQYSNYSTVLKS